MKPLKVSLKYLSIVSQRYRETFYHTIFLSLLSFLIFPPLPHPAFGLEPLSSSLYLHSAAGSVAHRGLIGDKTSRPRKKISPTPTLY